MLGLGNLDSGPEMSDVRVGQSHSSLASAKVVQLTQLSGVALGQSSGINWMGQPVSPCETRFKHWALCVLHSSFEYGDDFDASINL